MFSGGIKWPKLQTLAIFWPMPVYTAEITVCIVWALWGYSLVRDILRLVTLVFPGSSQVQNATVIH